MNAKAARIAARDRIAAALSATDAVSINADGEYRVSAKQAVWFRNGGRPPDAAQSVSIKNLRRIKPGEFFANSSRFNFNANTCDLSTDVGIRSSELKATEKRGGRSSKMFFLLRLAFWIGLVLVLLPRDKTVDPDKTPQLNASEAVSAATAAISDMGQFCKRQPTACEVGGQAANVIGQRAQGGARKLYQIITDKPDKSDKPEKSDKRAPDHTGSIGGMDPEAAPLEVAHDTLTPEDTQIEWQGASPPSP
jgi:hypothetical protein